MGWGNLLLKNRCLRIGHIFTWKLSDIMLIQNCSHHGPWGLGGATKNWKKIFSRTSRPISIKIGTNHPWVQGILNCTNKRLGPL
jgi:hypothetical protein